MFSQGSLLLILVVGLTTSLPQPFKWAKLKLFPEAPIPNPLSKEVQEISNVPGGIEENVGLKGAIDISGSTTLPNFHAKGSLPLLEGDLVVNAGAADKPDLPKLGVPGTTDISILNTVLNINAKDSLPLTEGDLVIPDVPGEKTSLPKLAVPGSVDIPGLATLPNIHTKDSLPLPEGDMAFSVVTANKSKLPKLGVPGASDIPELATPPNIHTKESLPLPEGDLVATANKPNLPKLCVPGTIDNSDLNTLPNINAKYSLPLPEDLAITAVLVDKPNLAGSTSLPNLDAKDSLPLPVVNADEPDLPKLAVPGANNISGLNNVANTNAKDSLPLPEGDLVNTAVTTGRDKPNIPKLGVPALTNTSSQWQDLYHRLHRLEAALKLQGKIHEVGDKMMVTSGKEVDFVTSKSMCKDIGGQIATLKSEAENIAVLALVKKNNRCAYLEKTDGPMPVISKSFNGVPNSYKWKKDEPRGKGKATCVEMNTDGQLKDKACNKKCLNVCQL